MSDSNVEIYGIVQTRYGDIAEGVSESCCGDDACCNPSAELLYDDASALEDLPVDVTNLSLGCGDPVSIASLNEGDTVVDLGSGGGIDCFLAAKQVGETGHVIGVDMTPAMLQKANAAKEKMAVSNIEFRQGQIEDLPIDANSVDVIMSNCVINLSPQKDKVFQEAIRVLKPGGRVAISDIVTEGEFTPELRADTEKWAECVVGAIDIQDYIGLMQQAGFERIDIVSKSNADSIVPIQDGMPRVFSARITAYKPQ